MSRGRAAGRSVAGSDHTPPGMAFEPSPDFTVIISSDDSATIDGVPVPRVEGEPTDTAILDTLHGYAQARGASVTASISDLDMGYLALVEVSPDGSSTLLEQSGEPSGGHPGAMTMSSSTTDDDGRGATGSVIHRDEIPLADVDDRTDSINDSTPLAPPRRGRSTRQSDDEYESPGLLNRPLIVGPVAIGVAALVVIPLIAVGSEGSSGDGSKTRAVDLGSAPSEEVPVEEATKYPSASPSTLPSLADSTKGSPSPTKTRSTPEGARKSETTTARPKVETAATSVQRLARKDPAGRHVCYRAYVSGQGWQKLVCDGTTTAAPSRGRPITALNIAVSGVGGSSANAFVHRPNSPDGKGHWKPKWTSVMADGKDNYIGSTDENAPSVLGFAINVGSGQICHTTRVRGADWGPKDCAKARPDFTFGGTLSNDTWLEAVRFTV